MVKGCTFYNLKNKLKFKHEELEEGAYAVRSMISQLFVHRNKDLGQQTNKNTETFSIWTIVKLKYTEQN